MCGCLLHAPCWGPGPQPRNVPWLGIEPEPFGSQACAQPTELHQPGLSFWILNSQTISYLKIKKTIPFTIVSKKQEIHLLFSQNCHLSVIHQMNNTKGKKRITHCLFSRPFRVIPYPGWEVQLVAVSSQTPKVYKLDYWLGRIPRLFDPWTGHVWEAILQYFSHIDVSLCFSLSFKSVNIFLGEDFKRSTNCRKLNYSSCY